MPQIAGLSSRAIIGTFYEVLEEIKDSGWSNLLAMFMNSDQESETYKWLGFAPTPREWKGERQAKGLRTQGMSITNILWEITLAIATTDLRRDKTGQINVRLGEAAERFQQHKESKLTTLIIDGDGTASGLAYDGQQFFDTDHSEGDSGTQKNLLTNSEVPALNVDSATAPTQDEMANAILGVIAHILSLKDDQGEPANGAARKFLVMVPAVLWPVAFAATTKNMLSAAAGTVKPSILDGGGFTVDAVMNPRLTWTDNFAVFRTDGRAKPFIYQEEYAPQAEFLGEGSEHEVLNNEQLLCLDASYNLGFGMWQHAAKATLS